jgi:hypothetical protein
MANVFLGTSTAQYTLPKIPNFILKPMIVKVRVDLDVDFKSLNLPDWRTRVLGAHPIPAPEEIEVDCMDEASAIALMERLNKIHGVVAKLA